MKWGKKELCEEECLIKIKTLNSGTGQPQVALHGKVLFLTLAVAPPTHSPLAKTKCNLESRLNLDSVCSGQLREVENGGEWKMEAFQYWSRIERRGPVYKNLISSRQDLVVASKNPVRI